MGSNKKTVAASGNGRRRPRRAFDKSYYDRFYEDPETRVTDPELTGRLGEFVCSYLAHLDVEVKSVLDVGCGTGLWQTVIAAHLPEATYKGVEVSEYLCRRYGWEQASVADFKPRRPFDLVICQGVLQYLDEKSARAAIENLGALTSRALFLEVLTQEDWDEVCDQDVTDDQCYLRPAAWYASRLKKHFTNCGGGVYLSKNTEHFVYRLDRLD